MTKYLAPFAPAQGPSPSLPSAVTSKPPPTTTSTGSTSSVSSSPPVPGYHPTTPPVPDWLPLARLALELLNGLAQIPAQEFRVPTDLPQGPRHDVLLCRVDRLGEGFHPIRSRSSASRAR